MEIEKDVKIKIRADGIWCGDSIGVCEYEPPYSTGIGRCNLFRGSLVVMPTGKQQRCRRCVESFGEGGKG